MGGFGNGHYFVGAEGVLTEHGWDYSRTITGENNEFNSDVYKYIDVIKDEDGQESIWYSLDRFDRY